MINKYNFEIISVINQTVSTSSSVDCVEDKFNRLMYINLKFKMLAKITLCSPDEFLKAVQYGTEQNNFSTVHYSTVKYSTVKYSTV